METRPPAAQAILCTFPALMFGLVTGIILDLSAALYGLFLILALLGGILAGVEHGSPAEGAQRGIVSGLFFGLGVVAGHHLLTAHAKASLPHPEALEVVVAALASVPLGMFGAFLRTRLERRTPAGGERDARLA